MVGTAQPVRRDLLLRARMPRGPLSVSLRGSAPSLFNPSSCLNRWAANRPSCPSLEPPLGRESDSRLPQDTATSREEKPGNQVLPKPNRPRPTSASIGGNDVRPGNSQASLRWHFGQEKAKRGESISSDVSTRRETPTCTSGPNLNTEF